MKSFKVVENDKLTWIMEGITTFNQCAEPSQCEHFNDLKIVNAFI